MRKIGDRNLNITITPSFLRKKKGVILLLGVMSLVNCGSNYQSDILIWLGAVGKNRYSPKLFADSSFLDPCADPGKYPLLRKEICGNSFWRIPGLFKTINGCRWFPANRTGSGTDSLQYYAATVFCTEFSHNLFDGFIHDLLIRFFEFTP